MLRLPLTLLVVFAVPVHAQQVFVEVEPNEDKPSASLADCISDGDLVTGWVCGSGCPPPGDRDLYRVTSCDDVPGIYRHRLEMSFSGPALPRLLGRTQSNGVVDELSDVTLQEGTNATVPQRFNQWYGFGKQEEVYYDVGMPSFNRNPWQSPVTVTPVTPTPVPGTFLPGTITIHTLGLGHGTNTELWVYDGDYNAIPGYGNDDIIQNLQEQSRLTRTYGPGTYTLALSDYNLANNLASPPEDDMRAGRVLDFPNLVACSSAEFPLDVTFQITDGNTTVTMPAMKPGPYDVLWFEFTVAGAPGSTSFCPGDGSQLPCPCANESVPGNGEGCRNATGFGGLLLASGTTGVTSDDLLLHATHLTPGGTTLLFASMQPQSTALQVGDGLLCIAPPLVRMSFAAADSTGTLSWGPGLAVTAGWAAGDIVHLQAAYRSTGPCGTGFLFTNGVAVTLTP
ncbi:MAG: hypothetical protein GY711_20395 [bacterium]|nr:hypothetical protein [bacterium]